MRASKAARPPAGALWLTSAAVRKLFSHTSNRDGINHICQRALRQRGDGGAPRGAQDDREHSGNVMGRRGEGRREKRKTIQQ